MNVKSISSKKLPRLIKTLKKKRKRIVFTNGCFDLLHPGHMKLFKEAKKQGDVLIVGLNSDSSIKKIKNPHRPILSQKERIQLLSGIAFIDYLTVFSEPDPLRLIKRITPDVLVKGGDWKKKDIIGGEFVEKNGGRIYRVKPEKGLSTTALIDKIKRLQPGR